MEQTLEESKRLASLAVFRELYDSEKDIYGIISCFLAEVIIEHGKHNFNLYEITCLLNDSFSIHIPEAVVKTSLGRLDFVKKDQGAYNATLSGVKSPSLTEKKDEIIKSNNLIVEKLLKFIEAQKKETITDIEKEKVIHSFCSFILNKSNGQEYAGYISAFIISNQDDQYFTKQLALIKEGVVLYTGIMFNDNIANVGSWNTEMTIILETEILFDFAGFNGELYNTLFNEFFTLVKEINQKSKKTLIRLRFFAKSKDEIEIFFKKAEYIVDGKDKANPKVTAMGSILDGCKSKSDVVAKKTDFFRLLEINNIEIDDYLNYYEESNHKYNIVDKKIIKSISESIHVDDISSHLELLNFINIRRGEFGDNRFEHIKYILLSGNVTTLQIAWHELIRPSGNVPLSTDLAFLTDKFWFKLNKGFGANTFPKTFDIITKAQILLSSQLNEAVGKKFEELKNNFKSGELTEEQASALIIDLRKQARKPEDIKKDDLTSILESISENSINKMIQEQELFKQKAKKHEEENAKLKKELEMKNSQMTERLAEEEMTKQSLVEKNNQLGNALDAQKRVTFLELNKTKENIDKKIENHILIFYKLFPIALILIYIGIQIFLVIKFGWSNYEPWSYFLSLLIPILGVVITLYKEKTINPIKWLENKKDKCKLNKYNKYRFDLQSYEQLVNDCE